MARKKKRHNTREKIKKHSFWHNIWNVIANKQGTNGEYTNILFAGLMSGILNIFAIILCLLAIIGIFGTVDTAVNMDWSRAMSWFSNSFTIIILLLFCLSALIFALIFRGFANEIQREKRNDYLIAVFSGITGFVALIVAFVALFKGVA